MNLGICEGLASFFIGVLQGNLIRSGLNSLIEALEKIECHVPIPINGTTKTEHNQAIGCREGSMLTHDGHNEFYIPIWLL